MKLKPKLSIIENFEAVEDPRVDRSGGDYVLALKGNQGNLFEDVQQIFKSAQSQDFKDIDYGFHETLDMGHGRIEKHRCWSLGQVDWLIDAEK